MSYIRGEDRGQMALLPAAIEDYVAEDAPVRVIDAFVDGLRQAAFLSVGKIGSPTGADLHRCNLRFTSTS